MSHGKTRLLIVDDEPATRHLLSEIFSRMGHEVVCAEDGFSALRQIRKSAPDVILSDLNMPGMSGFELLSVVRRRLPGIYVIATSGAYSGKSIPHAIAADAFYEKASSLKDLFEAVKTASEGRSRAVHPDAASAPIWISPDYASTLISIGCPECLRTFPQRPPTDGFIVHEAECPFCYRSVHYAVVDVLDPVSEIHYQTKLDAERLTPVASA
jgi:CheY-like chemotaxis protein